MRLKLKKPIDLDQKGLVHYVLPALSILAVAVIGTYVISSGHAATKPLATFADYQSAEQVAGVTAVSAEVPNLQNPVMVSQVAPGAQLNYGINSRDTFQNACYYVNIPALKGTPSTAKVEFTAVGKTQTLNLSTTPSSPFEFQRVCVDSGQNPTTENFNVANLSPIGGANVLVYQAIFNY
jgi:hypothetical protein